MSHKVLVVGLGDLAERIASRLAVAAGVDLVLAGRHRERGRALARLTSGLAGAPVRHVALDALDRDQAAALIADERPECIVQCASLVSPWALVGRDDAVAQALRGAGFALQASAQLPCVAAMLQAARDAGHAGSFVNCSYPDLTHPVLQRSLGVAPDVGIGNAGMVHGLLHAGLAPAQRTRTLRVWAHHFHVGAVARGDGALLRGLPGPRAFLDGHEIDVAALAFGQAPLALDRRLNELTAAHACRVVRGLLPDAEPLHTAAPGPAGLAGGWPVKVEARRVALDLPAGTRPADFEASLAQAARGDGIEAILADGTIVYTAEAQDRLWHVCRELALPLAPSEAPARVRVLRDLIGLRP